MFDSSRLIGGMWGRQSVSDFMGSIIANSLDFVFSLQFLEYNDEAALIPKNTSVLVRRVPGCRRMPIVVEREK